MEEKIKELGYAKKAVMRCLEYDGVLVDMHGLEYWAGVVERLRKEIKEMLWWGGYMLVVYELYINENNEEDELNLFDCDSLKEAKYFFEYKLGVKTSLRNLSKHTKNKGIINKKYRIYKIK